MKKIGKIYEFNGRVGTIINDDEEISFSIKDVYNKDVKEGDIVIYREETREPDIKIARNITKIENE